ncbi:MAG: HNH endonuclease [Bacteroidia bacterium]|nr:HNH endonuclease [Bacteroidia bacterium]
MKEGQKLWTKEELILAINLYCKLPFGKLHNRNLEIIELAKLIGRTSGSVAFKLVNFASLDPSLKARGIKGATNSSKLDKEVWDEFYNHWDVLPYESEKLLAKLKHTSVEALNQIPETDLPREGKMREQLVKTRVNQSFFRRSVLSAYNNACCITGLERPELLVAGHIMKWSEDEKNRLNPQNGLSLNNLHDKAFENGLISITPEYRIKIASVLKKDKNKMVVQNFHRFENRSIFLPARFLPDKDFLEHHYRNRFQK